MKKIIVLMSLVALGQFAMAQVKEAQPAESNKTEGVKPGEGKEHHKKHRQDKMAMMKDLNLSEEQKAKLKEMNAANKEKKQAILNDPKLTDEQKKAQLKEMKKGQKKNMQAVLNDEQKSKMKEMRSKMKEGRKHGKGMKGKKVEAAPAPQQQ